MENPRGYAFVTFARSYETMSSYNWYAAKAAVSHSPTKGEYMEEALALYDAMAIDIDISDDDAVHTLANDIVKYISSSQFSESLGFLSRPNASSGGQYIPRSHTLSPVPMDGDDGDTTVSPLEMAASGVEDSAYTQVEDDDLMVHRMRFMSSLLTKEQMRVLTTYVDGDAATMKEAATLEGLDDAGYNRVRQAIRYAAKEYTKEPLLQVSYT